MGLKKKKNVIVLTLCMVSCFILYQLYFFLTITSEAANTNKVVPILDSSNIIKEAHLRSEEDKFINENGVLRGVFKQNMAKYRPDKNNEFKCLNSEQRIPFDRVNDDYCDCEDGTDEPSTSACPTGLFSCETQDRKRPNSLHTVPSGKVNDGICDCCDGSDEWLYKSDKKLLTQGFTYKLYRYYANKCLYVC